MKIGIIHITDIHQTENTDLSNKVYSLCQEMKNEFSTIDKRYVVITGDIANKGKKAEYNTAKKFIDKIIDELNISKIVMVPGNHDCNFDYNNKIRDLSVSNTDYDKIGKDGSVIDNALEVQKDFWQFYREYLPIPENKLYYRINDKYNDKTVSFHCINTSWISRKNEEPGSLFFPVKLMDSVENKGKLNISVFHHPINWFTPNSKPNNKNEFQKYVDNLSSIKLIGHEHEQKSLKITNLDTDIDSLEFSGKVFNKGNSAESGFQFVNISLETQKGYIKKYNWDEKLYVCDSTKKIDIQKQQKRELKLQESFLKIIEDIKVPLTFPNKKINLSDIFVFPDIEENKLDYDDLEDYESSEKLITYENMRKVILYGESQIGKTSLLQMLFIKYYNAGYYPILLDGEDIDRPDINKIIKKKFDSIYSISNYGYERYRQIEEKYKILMIDDFHLRKINSNELEQLIDQINDLYSNILITDEPSCQFSTESQTVLNDLNRYTIKPFGYKKTDEVIKKYFSLKKDFYTLNEQEKLSKIRHTFDKVRNLLGDKILPSYPVFILSILKTLDDSTYSLKETSYGYCYESMLYFTLKSNAKLEEDELSQYLSFIEQLAFDQFTENKTEFNEEYFKNFYINYSENYIIDDFHIIKQNLINSYIIKEYDNTYRFGYKYIFYYLVAKHIAGIIDKDKGKKIVEELFDKLHLEKNANILVFITHHTRNNDFIQDSVYHAMEPFVNVQPITLNKNCHYYKLLENLGDEVIKEIVEADIDPLKERDEILTEYDRTRKVNKKNQSLENDEINEYTQPYIRAFKSIDIVSQIIKNRLGYLEKSDIIDYIKELYLNGFRTIGSIGKIFTQEKEDLTKKLIKAIIDEKHKKAEDKEYRLHDPVTKEEIRNKVNNFFQMINLQVCLGIFSKLIDTVGIKERKMKKIYNATAEEINTPAARLVTFSIKSYYYGASINEIKDLAEEFENNPVALKILKSRTISYVYNNYIDFRKKQKIASILNLKFKPNLKRLQK